MVIINIIIIEKKQHKQIIIKQYSTIHLEIEIEQIES